MPKFFSFKLAINGEELTHNIVSLNKDLAISYVLELYENKNVNIVSIREECVHNLIMGAIR